MTDIEWACRFVEWPFRGEGVVPLYDGANSAPRSIADLAEAVREKFFYDLELPRGLSKHEVLTAVDAWVKHGPLAFIRAVREVVNG